jgi:hypothetical protein
VLFIFPGLEPNNWSRIVQPVLQYGFSAAGGGNFWGMADWYVVDGVGVNSPLTTVTPDTVINTSMNSSSCNSLGQCGWTIGWKVSGGTWQNLTVSPAISMQSIYEGVLETWNLTNCNQLPEVDFTEVFSVYAYAGGPAGYNARNLATLTTTTNGSHTTAPDCGWYAEWSGYPDAYEAIYWDWEE